MVQAEQVTPALNNEARAALQLRALQCTLARDAEEREERNRDMLMRLDGMLVRLDNMRARGEKVIGELDEVIEALSKLPDRPQRD